MDKQMNFDGDLTTNEHGDLFLEKRLHKYDKWIEKKQISYSSKVIPLAKSIAAKQWVLPANRVLEILKQMDFIAVQNCECRTHYKRCDNPLEVCLLFNSVAKAIVKKGKARAVDIEEASEIIKMANDRGLVHLSLYMPDHQIFALCSCCSCCCHDLQIVKKYNRKELMVWSDYIAVTDEDECISCGECIDLCIFNARFFSESKLSFDAVKCFGCGVCVTKCPVEAIRMENR